MEPVVDHIEITAIDMTAAVPFYDRLLPLLGFDVTRSSEAVIEQHEKHVVSYEHPRLGFAITSPWGAFALLTLAAQGDEEFEGLLTAILSLPRFHRKSLLNTFVQELSMKQAPPELIRSVGYLLDDDVATRALTTWKGTDDGG